MFTLDLRDATTQDVEYLTQLRLRTIHEHIRNAGTDLSFEEHEKRASTRLDCCSVISWSNRTVGMIKVIREVDSWTIEQFQIEPEFQRRGLGASLLSKLQQDAKNSGVALLLSVLSVNPALSLYRRLGFEVLRESNGIIEMRSGSSDFSVGSR